MLVSIIYSSTMVFYSRIPSVIVMCLGVLYLLFLYYNLRQLFNRQETLFLCSVFLVPTSTISILGTSYSSFPLSWFHVLVLLLFLRLFISAKANRTYFCLLFICVGYLVILAFFGSSIFDAMKQVLTITLFLLSFPIGASLSKHPSQSLLVTAADAFVCSSVAFGAQVFLQRAFISSSGIVIGHYTVTGQGRYSYAGLMGDYSFATVYLAAGCMITLIAFMDWGRIRLFRFMILEVFLLAATLAVTARTGLAALAIILVIYFLRNLRRINWKTTLLLVLGILAVPVILNELIILRVGQSLLDSSGRFVTYQKALNLIIMRPLFGVGLGIENLYEGYHMGLPHNFFMQYLAQIGIVGTLLVLSFFIVYLRKSLVRANEMKWVFWLIVVSCMMIPDIFSSRFFYVIIILCMLPAYRRRKPATG